MRILIDVGHPAHVHFFRHPLAELVKHGHEVTVTSRKKDVALDLLDELNIRHQPLSEMKHGGLLSLARELIQRNAALFGVVRRFRPDIMAAIGGISIAQVGRLTGVPSLVFYDTENARLQNAMTYPFASCVVVPECYEAWVPKRRHIRYPGYHELSYLHPARFTPDRKTALAHGLAAQGDTYFIRTVSWQANHDWGERGWNREMLRRIVERLSATGKVLISSETPLEDDLARYRYTGSTASVHHVLAFCRAYIGESATMASECAVLGVPALYVAHTRRGYTNEQERLYGLVMNIDVMEWARIERGIDRLLALSREACASGRRKLLAERIDVAGFVAQCIETYPSLHGKTSKVPL